MRRALFAVVLVAASFAGGVVVNGPGLRWAQSAVLNRLGGGSDDEGDAVPVVTPAAEIPARPIPPLVLDPAPAPVVAPASRDATAKAESGPYPRPIPGADAGAGEPSRSGLAPPAGESLSSIEPPAPLITSQDREREALAMAKADADANAAPKLDLAPADADAVAGKTHDADAVAPSDAMIRRVSMTDEPAPAPSGEPADWAEVRKVMRSLGVSRYGIDGDPSGRTRFHCVIPLAGRRAVGQHFEAEGDDELQAARAALKRIALWRATEEGPHVPAP